MPEFDLGRVVGGSKFERKTFSSGTAYNSGITSAIPLVVVDTAIPGILRNVTFTGNLGLTTDATTLYSQNITITVDGVNTVNNTRYSRATATYQTYGKLTSFHQASAINGYFAYPTNAELGYFYPGEIASWRDLNIPYKTLKITVSLGTYAYVAGTSTIYIETLQEVD